MNIPSLEVRLRFGPDVDYRVGVLASVERSFAFQYDDAFLSRDLRISPFRLPAQPGVQVYDGQGGMDVFGV